MEERQHTFHVPLLERKGYHLGREEECAHPLYIYSGNSGIGGGCGLYPHIEY